MRNAEPSIAFSTPQLGFRNRVAPVAQGSERRASNAEVAGETPAGSASKMKSAEGGMRNRTRVNQLLSLRFASRDCFSRA